MFDKKVIKICHLLCPVEQQSIGQYWYAGSNKLLDVDAVTGEAGGDGYDGQDNAKDGDDEGARGQGAAAAGLYANHFDKKECVKLPLWTNWFKFCFNLR
jgi:hypothetical protein